jgi:hypothetical protein
MASKTKSMLGGKTTPSRTSHSTFPLRTQWSTGGEVKNTPMASGSTAIGMNGMTVQGGLKKRFTE